MLPRHIFVPGEQTPTQLPATHMLVHAAPRSQLPFASQVRGVLTSQRRSPGMQSLGSASADIASPEPSLPTEPSGFELPAPPAVPVPDAPPIPVPAPPPVPTRPPFPKRLRSQTRRPGSPR